MHVYYAPTDFNKKLVNAAAERLPGKLAFRKLSKFGAYRRHWQLQQIDGPAVFIWGSGWRHHESYYFTGKKVDAKAIIDQHPDNLKFSKGELARGITCVNHMLATAKLGVETIVMASGADGSAPLLDGKARMNFSAKNALTVDFDCVPFFPAEPMWVLTDEKAGFRVEAIVKFVEANKPKIQMLDMGGVAEKSPDFAVKEGMRAPTHSEISCFCHKMKTGQQVEKSLADVVMNYALDAYLRVLGAFAKE